MKFSPIMKKIFVTLVAILITFCACGRTNNVQNNACKTNETESEEQASNAGTDWEKYELKGKVKQLTIRYYDAHEQAGTLVKDRLRNTFVIDFNEDGTFRQADWGDSKETYTYSQNRKTVNHYNEKGEWVKKTITVYTYTPWGAIQSKVYTNDEGIEMGREDYTYNENRQVTDRILQGIAFPYTHETNLLYDSAGHEVQCERFDRDGELKETEKNIYDASGNRIMHRVERFDGGIYAYGGAQRYTYNPEGFVSMIEGKGDEDDDFHISYKISYIYDDKGNYTVKNTMTEQFPSIQERDIVYY